MKIQRMATIHDHSMAEAVDAGKLPQLSGNIDPVVTIICWDPVSAEG
jgi:hypothetical protein